VGRVERDAGLLGTGPGPTEHLRRIARRIVAEALKQVPLRAALLTGSGGRGDADAYSDLDLIVYVDELPPDDVLVAIREAVGGTDPKGRDRTDHFCGEEFRIGGVRTEVSFGTVARVEWRLDQLLERLEEIDSPLQKVALGILEGTPLHGEELIARWQARLRDYPEPLRRAMIERHWRFVPLWYQADSIAMRDAELWRVDALLEGAFNLLAVLAGLNRLYFTRFELKRMRALVASMELAPPRLAERLESLFRLEATGAAAELGRLVNETRALVAAEFPHLELSLEHAPGTRQQPWTRPGNIGRSGSSTSVSDEIQSGGVERST
jgi:Nucleotidyltransferase domain